MNEPKQVDAVVALLIAEASRDLGRRDVLAGLIDGRMADFTSPLGGLLEHVVETSREAFFNGFDDGRSHVWEWVHATAPDFAPAPDDDLSDEEFDARMDAAAKPAEDQAQEIEAMLIKLHEGVSTKGASKWTTFRAFLEAKGHDDPVAAVRVLNPGLVDALSRLPVGRPDQEHSNEFHEALEEAWRR